MNLNNDDPKNSLVLFGLQDKFKFLADLYDKEKLPKVLLVSGNKGIGKFTLINHFMTYIFDKKNYDSNKHSINKDTTFYKQHFNNLFQDIIYLPGEKLNKIKINDVRDLKSTILKSSAKTNKRFIILDDVETFNKNSLNALLKLVEEPSLTNYFILINNKTKPLIDTIRSRCIEIKILLNQKKRIEIIESLIEQNQIDTHINFKSHDLSPGNFIIFNQICLENAINIEEDYLNNLSLILSLYKKNKDINLINMIYFLTNKYFNNLSENKIKNIDDIIENKSFVFKNINNFLVYNLNQNSLFNAINDKLQNE